MPMNSFLTSTSPSLGSGTGRSVLYCSTSVPPVFSISTPAMVLGIEDAIVRMCLGGKGDSMDRVALSLANAREYMYVCYAGMLRR